MMHFVRKFLIMRAYSIRTQHNFFIRRRQDTHFNLAIMKQKARESRYSAKDHYFTAEGCIVASGVRRNFLRGGARNSGGPQDLAQKRYNRGSGGVAPSCQRIFAVFTKKTLILAHFFIEKGRAVSAVTKYKPVWSKTKSIKGRLKV